MAQVTSLVPHDNNVMDAGRQNRLLGDHMSSAPILASILEPTYAYREFDHFDRYDDDDTYVTTQATAGTADVIDGAGGILQLDSASGTTDQGIQVQHKTETFKLAANKHIWFEARVNVDAITAIGIDGSLIFVGLSVLDTTIFASGETTATDYIGWVLDATQQAAAAGIIQLEIQSASGSEEKTVSGQFQFVEAAYVKLGFLITSNTTLQAYVNGVAVGDALTMSSAPSTEMAASFACLSEGVASADPIMLVDYYECIQII